MEPERWLGARIGTIRKRRGLTQTELAGRIGRSLETVSSLERGKHMPNFDILQRLASALGVPLHEFLVPPGDASGSTRHAALFSELLDMARSLPLADLEMAVRIIQVVAGRTGAAASTGRLGQGGPGEREET